MTTSQTPSLSLPLEAAPGRLSLRLSYLYYGGACIAAGGLGLAVHTRILWLAVFGVAAVAFLNPRRIDLDGESLVLVPLFGFPQQRIPLAALGPFELRGRFGGSGKGVSAVVRADISRGHRYRVSYLFPTKVLKIPALYGPGYLAPSLSRTDLVAALERSREAGLAGALDDVPADGGAPASTSAAAPVPPAAVRVQPVSAAAVVTPQQAALRTLLTVLLDEGRALAAEVDSGASDPRVAAWLEGVRRTLAEGRPGVAAYVDALGARTYTDDAERLRAYLGRLATVVRDFF